MRYGKWPHEVAALPFHYYLALREDWIKVHAPRQDVEGEASEEDVIEFDTQVSVTGEAV